MYNANVRICHANIANMRFGVIRALKGKICVSFKKAEFFILALHQSGKSVFFQNPSFLDFVLRVLCWRLAGSFIHCNCLGSASRR